MLAVVMTFSVLTASTTPTDVPVHTFSIVAKDPDAQEWGVAVASRALAVGGLVPYAKARVGAIAEQSVVNVDYGQKGLELLEQGKSAEEALKERLAGDDKREIRQVGIIDAKGGAAQFTGKECVAWAGGRTGKNYACQGNMLTGKEVIDAMADTFEKTKGPLAWRLALALEAGDKAGGDKRGKQSAALLVVRVKNDWAGRYIDFRVDDHTAPVTELLRILGKAVERK
jgi:uncharacterized Ntn-hydrolase superfamily protein